PMRPTEGLTPAAASRSVSRIDRYTPRPNSAGSATHTGCSSQWARRGVLGRAGGVVLRDVQARADRASDLADARSRSHSDGALALSDLQPAAPALGHRHAEPR